MRTPRHPNEGLKAPAVFRREKVGQRATVTIRLYGPQALNGWSGWVSTQRQRQRLGKLDPARAARLGALQGWVWDPHDDAWERGLDHLLRFVECEGHAKVPQLHSENGFALGRWVGKKRQAYRKGALALDRARRLEELAGWTWEPR
jgi:hypothetical protein